MHTCQVCIPVAEQLGGLLEMLRSGVAFALNAVRSEAKNQLQGDQVAQLRSSVDEITAPLQELKAGSDGCLSPDMSGTPRNFTCQPGPYYRPDRLFHQLRRNRLPRDY